MDIYNPRNFRATDNFNATEYFKEYGEFCSPPVNSATEIFQNLIGDTDLGQIGVDLVRLEEQCNMERFRLPNEPLDLPLPVPKNVTTKTPLEIVYPITNEAKHLGVICVKEKFGTAKSDIDQIVGSKRFIKSSVALPKDDIFKRKDLIPGSEFIYSIFWYRPFSLNYGQKNSTEKLRFMYEVEALGSNFLSAVIDLVECPSDSMILPEVEDTKVDIKEFKDARRWYPSRTLFIDGVFYNDMRHPDAKDLTPNLIKWAADKKFDKFTTAKLEETRFSDLKPRIGYPYVYIHQGDCEHIFVFSDARLLQFRDSLVSSTYPKIVSFNRISNIMCMICIKRVVKWLVRKCDRFPHERVFLCTNCCDSYLYIDGKKVTDFKLYPMFEE